MARGLIVGKVVLPSGAPAVGFTVLLRTIQAGFSLMNVDGRNVDTKTDKAGEFGIGFGWSGAELSEDVSSVSAALIALNNYGTKTMARPSASGVQQVTCYLMIDPLVASTSGVAAQPLKNFPSLLSFGVSIASKLAKFKTLPVHKAHKLISAERFMLIGAGSIQIRQ